jgi:hypothetical protein
MKYACLLLCFGLSGCALQAVSTSNVREFFSLDAMNQVGSCNKIGDFNHRYSVFMLSPGDRQAATHAQLKRVTESMGGNAAVMLTYTSVFGEINDTVQGIAYQCDFNT